MNLLWPPAMAAVVLVSFVSANSFDQGDGDERVFAADNMVRHHTIAVATFPARTKMAAPFVDVLAWKTVAEKDTQDRDWLLTFLSADAAGEPTTIGDTAISMIPLELARRRYDGGTYGMWEGDTLKATIGPITFSGGQTTQIPDKSPVIATLR